MGSRRYASSTMPKRNLRVKFMRTVGKVGTVSTGKDGKLGKYGAKLMFLGYTDKHGGNCGKMVNPLKNSVVETYL